MSSSDDTVAQRTVDVLPGKVSRRVTRRDGLLPLVFAVELLAGVAFGLAAHSGHAGATSVPAKLTLAPVALVTVRPPAVVSVPVSRPPYRRHAPRNPFGTLAHAS